MFIYKMGILYWMLNKDNDAFICSIVHIVYTQGIVLTISLAPSGFCDLFTHICRGCFTGTATNVILAMFNWNNPNNMGKISYHQPQQNMNRVHITCDVIYAPF